MVRIKIILCSIVVNEANLAYHVDHLTLEHISYVVHRIYN